MADTPYSPDNPQTPYNDPYQPQTPYSDRDGYRHDDYSDRRGTQLRNRRPIVLAQNVSVDPRDNSPSGSRSLGATA